LPTAGSFSEVLNTDAEMYGGTNVGNLGAVVAEKIPWHGLDQSALVTLPPLGVIWLLSEPLKAAVESPTSKKSSVDRA
jgi:1,4-alpha-glucan branching enzyme